MVGGAPAGFLRALGAADARAGQYFLDAGWADADAARRGHAARARC